MRNIVLHEALHYTLAVKSTCVSEIFSQAGDRYFHINEKKTEKAPHNIKKKRLFHFLGLLYMQTCKCFG
jgi:hypothetical protein